MSTTPNSGQFKCIWFCTPTINSSGGSRRRWWLWTPFGCDTWSVWCCVCSLNCGLGVKNYHNNYINNSDVWYFDTGNWIYVYGGSRKWSAISCCCCVWGGLERRGCTYMVHCSTSVLLIILFLIIHGLLTNDAFCYAHTHTPSRQMR